jgi:hypothetical protein
MTVNVGRDVAAMERMTTKQLRERYAEIFGEATAANNKAWLMKRIAWRLQANAEGGLSERATARAAALASDAELRTTPPPEKLLPPVKAGGATRVLEVALDDRLPPPGSFLTRKYKGGTVQVKVLDDGFEYAGEAYASLSAVAKAVTGSHCNGFLFFRLGKHGGDR